MIILEVAATSYEGYAKHLFLVPEELRPQLKRIVFESMKEAYDRINIRNASIEYIIWSPEFIEAMTKRGLQHIKPDVSFVFWGWNSKTHLWEDASDELDRELYAYLFGDE